MCSFLLLTFALMTPGQTARSRAAIAGHLRQTLLRRTNAGNTARLPIRVSSRLASGSRIRATRGGTSKRGSISTSLSGKARPRPSSLR